MLVRALIVRKGLYCVKEELGWPSSSCTLTRGHGGGRPASTGVLLVQCPEWDPADVAMTRLKNDVRVNILLIGIAKWERPA